MAMLAKDAFDEDFKQFNVFKHRKLAKITINRQQTRKRQMRLSIRFNCLDDLCLRCDDNATSGSTVSVAGFRSVL
jgi:predicted metalloenzyme YecM